MFWIILFLFFGFFLLVKSADILVDGAAGLAKRYHVPKIIIGLTLVAFGTSAPEMSVSILASLQQNGSIAIGNILGSNIANIALIIGIMALLRVVPLRKSTITKGIPLNILAAMVFLILGFDVFFQNGTTVVNKFSLGDGLVLLMLFVIFLYYVFADLKVAEEMEEDIEKKERKYFRDTLPVLSAMVVGGLIGLLAGGKLVIDNAIALASALGLSEAVIGVTIVAIGTSLPELVTSLVAVRKRENDIAVGNIIGSNAFNVFLVLGAASVLHPINIETRLFSDGLIMLAVTILLFYLTFKKRQMARMEGLIFLGYYLAYFIFLAAREGGLIGVYS